MQERTRNRIIGFVFLGALALLTIPMLFDKADIDQVVIAPLEREPLESTFRPAPLPDIEPVLNAREEIANKIDKDGFLIDSGSRVGEPVLSEDDETANLWAIQLGSFRSEKNAVSLRNQMLDEEYKAWLSHVKVNGVITIRVVIGPITVKESAVSLRDELSAKYGLQPIVVSYHH